MFKMEIKTGGAAFRDDDGNLDPYGYEVAKLLENAAYHVRHGETSGILMDVNGNKVGHWKLED
jgi:hypothetical protein